MVNSAECPVSPMNKRIVALSANRVRLSDRCSKVYNQPDLSSRR
jgi:hypothetical protein